MIVAVLGAGAMAGAIAQALHSAGGHELRLTTRSSIPAWARGAEDVHHWSLAADGDTNRDAVTGADAVILGVKPGQISDLAREIRPCLSADALVISVAGGVTLTTLGTALDGHGPVVRAMPNTPVAVHRGVTAVAVTAEAPDGTLDRVVELLGSTGVVEPLAEELIDGFSAVIGSGPAYVYRVIEALQRAAVAQGLDPLQAARMVPAMVLGASEYLERSAREPADLRDEVTSPGGSTARALEVFTARGLEDMVADAVEAATRRARELGQS